jgi:3-phenylpropionate/trans-cinnamate dioxygenase ferredoxin subunit
MAWHKVSRLGDPEPGKVKVIVAGNEELALCNVGGLYYAIEDVCTHDGGPLDQGELDGMEIECPRHGARFDVCTGRATCLPAIMPVKTFPVKVEEEEIFVEV